MNNFSKTCIVIPSLNPNNKLTHLIEELCVYKWKKIIIIDDGSTQETVRVFHNIVKNFGITLITHETNKGKGAALKTGFNYIKNQENGSRGIITVDSDGQHLIEDIIKIAHTANEKWSNVIFGIRKFGKTTPFSSLIGNKVSSFLLDATNDITIDDCQTGLRYLPISLVDELLLLQSSRYDYELECLIRINTLGYNIIKIQIETVYLNKNKGSHFRGLVDSSRILLVLTRYSAISISSFGIDIFLFLLVLSYSESIFYATIIARIISGSYNFSLNKLFVFRSNGFYQIFKETSSYLILSIFVALLSASIVGLWKENAIYSIVIFKALVDTSLFFLTFYVQKNIIFIDRK